MATKPIAFMSYVRLDDQHENGRLTQFRERLSGEVRMQTGEEFEIFQDRNDIQWGQRWKERIEDTLDAITFLIPVITPGFFKSPACRAEFERFLRRERRLRRNDLILPVYYVECSILSSKAKRRQDSVAANVASRQCADWRDLRFEPFASPEVGKQLAKIARQVAEALERRQPSSRCRVKRKKRRAPGGPRAEAAQNSADAETFEPKTEVPTLVVDALHRGDHSTLTDALEAAKPGTKILVRPGVYREGVEINKPVEIVGDGERLDIVFEALDENVILFRSSMGRVANLTLRQIGGEKFCVNLAQGRLELEDCDISSRGKACVGIHDGADPRLRRNSIHDGNQGGVFVYANGRGTLEDNEIFGNLMAGVEIKDGGDPTLRRNRVHDGHANGILVGTGGRGVLEENEVFGNVRAGIAIKEGGHPTLRRNRISQNGQQGIWLREGGSGVFEGNNLHGNVGGAWRISNGAKSKIKREGNLE